MKRFRTIFTSFFALLVFFSSTSFSIDVHYCGGEIKGISFFQDADGCGHKKLPPCHRQLMKNCCEDELITHEGQGFNNEVTQIHIADASSIVLSALPVLISEIVPSFEIKTVKLYNYDTPLPPIDRTIVHQVFII